MLFVILCYYQHVNSNVVLACFCLPLFHEQCFPKHQKHSQICVAWKFRQILSVFNKSENFSNNRNFSEAISTNFMGNSDPRPAPLPAVFHIYFHAFPLSSWKLLSWCVGRSNFVCAALICMNLVPLNDNSQITFYVVGSSDIFFYFHAISFFFSPTS